MTFEVEVLTLFPRMIEGYVQESILGKAQTRGLLKVRTLDIRNFAPDKHRVTDDAPYGGGAGMVMKPEPTVGAIEDAKSRLPGAHSVRYQAVFGPVATTDNVSGSSA